MCNSSDYIIIILLQAATAGTVGAGQYSFFGDGGLDGGLDEGLEGALEVRPKFFR